MIEAAFETARRLFGLTFTPVSVPLYHPDARAWEVKDAQGRHVGLFIGDYFARGSKHSGAWMTSLRDQEKLIGRHAADHPQCLQLLQACGRREGCLLSFDDARTLFHEFGHAPARHVVERDLSAARRHVRCRAISSSCLRSFTSTGWRCRRYCRNMRVTPRPAEPMPKALLDRLLATRTFNQGFATVEYTACALVDLDLHALPDTAALDVGGVRAQGS